MERWEKRERQNDDYIKSPIFNWKIAIFVGIILFTGSLITAMIFPPIYAGEEDNTFKIFDDGVTWVKTPHSSYFGTQLYSNNILHEGKLYDCMPDDYHRNQYLDPTCIEIIVRTSQP